MNNELTESVLKQSENLHTAIDMVLDKSSELHKERQWAEQLYNNCIELWERLAMIRDYMPGTLGDENVRLLTEFLNRTNPSKLKTND